jgi:hypothetical protein
MQIRMLQLPHPESGINGRGLELVYARGRLRLFRGKKVSVRSLNLHCSTAGSTLTAGQDSTKANVMLSL